MNKSELIKALAEESNIPLDDASLVVNPFSDAGRNPKTGESVEVVPKRLPFFRAGKELKEFINS